MDEPILDSALEEDNLMPDKVEYAGFWIRVGASILDAIILLPLTALTFYNFMGPQSLTLMLVLTLAAALYKPLLEWQRAATLGKQIVGIKVVDENMNNISGAQALQRYFPWIIMLVFSLMTNFFLFNSPDFSEIGGLTLEGFMQMSMIMEESPYALLSQIYNFVFLIIVIVVAFDKKKQGLHDKFAKTYCIMKK